MGGYGNPVYTLSWKGSTSDESVGQSVNFHSSVFGKDGCMFSTVRVGIRVGSYGLRGYRAT